MLLRERLLAHGHDYADFPAHNGLWEMAENVRGVLAIEWLAACQGLDLRDGLKTSAKLEIARTTLRGKVPFYEKDRFFAPDIEAAIELLASNLEQGVRETYQGEQAVNANEQQRLLDRLVVVEQEKLKRLNELETLQQLPQPGIDSLPQVRELSGPPPYSPRGMSPSKLPYSSGWSSVCTARWFTAGSVGGPLGMAHDTSTPSCSSLKS